MHGSRASLGIPRARGTTYTEDMLRRHAWIAFASLSIACAGPIAPAPVVTESTECTGDAWCWMRGRPIVVEGDRARGVVIAYGAEGTYLRWDEAQGGWSATPRPTTRTFTSAWSASEEDAWASDEMGSAWHWDGSAWTEAPSAAPILRVLAATDGSAWAIAGGDPSGHGATSGAHLLRHDASGWSEPIPPYAFCLGGDFALPAGEVWTAGLTCDASGTVENVEVRRWDGSAWQLVGAPIPDQGWFPSLTTTSDGRVQVDASGRFAWDGASWAPAYAPEYPQDLGIGETAFWDGYQWVRVPWTMAVEGAFRLDESHTWAWGAGRIYFSQSRLPTAEMFQPTIATPYDATSSAEAWGTMPTLLWAGGEARAAWGRSPSDVYRALESGALEHYDGATWSPVAVSSFVSGIEGSESDVWLATRDGVMRGDAGRGFRAVAVPSEVGVPDRVHVLDDGSVIAVAREGVLVLDGDAFGMVVPSENGWYTRDARGSSRYTLWIFQPASGRSNDVRVLHGSGRGDWTVVAAGEPVPPEDAELWLTGWGFVGQLDGSLTLPPSPLFDYQTEGWAGVDAVWLMSGTQAVRLAR